MNIKQKSRVFSALAAFCAVAGVAAAPSPTTVSADPATTRISCVDGKTVTANKSAKPDTAILDEKDYAAACKDHKGYKNEDAAEETETSEAVGNPVAGTDCGGVKTAIIKCDAKNSGDTEDNGIWALLLLVLNILTAGVGIVAVGGIVYGAILYTTAEDKADQVKKATDIITNVVIGLVLFALMYGLLNFIVPGGVFA